MSKQTQLIDQIIKQEGFNGVIVISLKDDQVNIQTNNMNVMQKTLLMTTAQAWLFSEFSFKPAEQKNDSGANKN